MLTEGSKTRTELISSILKMGISVSELDNVILPSLVQKGHICKPTGFKQYKLRDCKNCEWENSCTDKNKE